MYTPGMIIKLSDERYGVVLDSQETIVKYLELSNDLVNVKSNAAIYPLSSDSFYLSTDNKSNVMYAHLDVICVADGTFKVVGRINSNESMIELISYLNGYRNYAKMVKERIDVDIAQKNIIEPAISLRKTI